MKRTEAIAGLGILVGSTNGWSDENIEIYADQCMRFSDPGAFKVAMQNLALTWSRPSRPMMHDVNVAYQSELRGREMERGILVEDTGPVLELEVGVEVARRAYYEECRRQGRQGSDDIFDHWIATIGRKREDRERHRDEQRRQEAEDEF